MRVFQVTALPANVLIMKSWGVELAMDGRSRSKRDLRSLAILARFDFKAAGASGFLWQNPKP